MKLAVINFSGNVGKTTVARHLLLPRIHGAELIAVESVNADGGEGRRRQGQHHAFPARQPVRPAAGVPADHSTAPLSTSALATSRSC